MTVFQITRVMGLNPAVLVVLIVLAGTGQGQDEPHLDGGDHFDIVKDPDETTVVFEGETTNLTFTLLSVNIEGDFTITLIPKDTEYFTLEFNELRDVSEEVNGLNATMEVEITGAKLVISEYIMVAINQESGDTYLIDTHYVKVLRVRSRVGLIVRYLVTAAVVATIWLIGITTDILIIIRILKRPYGVCIGMICQFVIMPFAAWSLAKIFQIDGAASVGLILDGSCPGGTNSNLLSVLLDVDYVLSITMTFVSTIMALGMMPLNLFIYGRAFITAGEQIDTPFAEIFLQLIILVVPLSIGIFIGYKFPKAKDFADNYIKPVSAFVVVILICTDLPFNLFIFDSPWEYYAAAIIFPLVGGLAGFTLSRAARLSPQKSLTVALETGVQNALLAITVLFFLYPQPEADLATRLPYLIVIFTTIEGLTLVVIYTLLKRFYWHGIPYAEASEDTKGLTKDDPQATNNNEDAENPGETPSDDKEVPSVSSGVSKQANVGSEPPQNGQSNKAFEPEV